MATLDISYPTNPKSLVLDELVDVSAPSDTVTGMGLGTTSTGQWGPVGMVLRSGDTMTGNLGITKDNAEIQLSGSAGTTRGIRLRTGTSNRWLINASGAAESGSNAGSSLSFSRYNDSGTLIDTPLQIDRATGRVILTQPVKVGNDFQGVWSSHDAAITQGATITKTAGYSQYCRIGDAVHFIGQYTLTSAGTPGSVIEVSLPVNSVYSSSSYFVVGNAMFFKSGSGLSNLKTTIKNGSPGTLRFFATGESVSSSNNFGTSITISNGDVLSVNVVYPVA